MAQDGLPFVTIGSKAYFESTDPEIVEEREDLRRTIQEYARNKPNSVETKLASLQAKVADFKKQIDVFQSEISECQSMIREK
jgi:peptidoglycan hydrolase CwlO-like protein